MRGQVAYLTNLTRMPGRNAPIAHLHRYDGPCAGSPARNEGSTEHGAAFSPKVDSRRGRTENANAARTGRATKSRGPHEGGRGPSIGHRLRGGWRKPLPRRPAELVYGSVGVTLGWGFLQ